MKTAKLIAKIAVALAAVAGVVYIVATYGNQIVAWCKKLLASLPCCKCQCECECEEVAEEAAAEEAVAEEAPAEEVVEAEADVEAPAEEAAVADEADFEN